MNFPYLSLTASVNVDCLVALYNANKISSVYGTIAWLCLTALNKIPEFLYDVKYENIVKYKDRGCSFTVLHDNNTYSYTPFVEYNAVHNQFEKRFKEVKKVQN